jgi:hypothetical protein
VIRVPLDVCGLDMTFFELLVFSLLCAALGFLGRLVSPRWGGLVGIIPFFAMIVS